MSSSFTSFRLRPFIQKHNSCTINHIRLHPTYIQSIFNFCNSHHIMIRRSPYLNNQISQIKNQPISLNSMLNNTHFSNFQNSTPKKKKNELFEEEEEEEEPEWLDVHCGVMSGNRSKMRRSDNPNNTYSVHFWRRRRACGRLRRTPFSTMVQATAAPTLLISASFFFFSLTIRKSNIRRKNWKRMWNFWAYHNEFGYISLWGGLNVRETMWSFALLS